MGPYGVENFPIEAKETCGSIANRVLSLPRGHPLKKIYHGMCDEAGMPTNKRSVARDAREEDETARIRCGEFMGLSFHECAFASRTQNPPPDPIKWADFDPEGCRWNILICPSSTSSGILK